MMFPPGCVGTHLPAVYNIHGSASSHGSESPHGSETPHGSDTNRIPNRYRDPRTLICQWCWAIPRVVPYPALCTLWRDLYHGSLFRGLHYGIYTRYGNVTITHVQARPDISQSSYRVCVRNFPHYLSSLAQHRAYRFHRTGANYEHVPGSPCISASSQPCATKNRVHRPDKFVVKGFCPPVICTEKLSQLCAALKQNPLRW